MKYEVDQRTLLENLMQWESHNHKHDMDNYILNSFLTVGELRYIIRALGGRCSNDL